jgi:hypothetical protein
VESGRLDVGLRVGNRSTCPSWDFRPKRPRCPSLSDCMILIDSVWLHGIALVEYVWCFECLECFDTMQYNQYAQKVSHQLMKTMQVTLEQRGTLHEFFEDLRRQQSVVPTSLSTKYLGKQGLSGSVQQCAILTSELLKFFKFQECSRHSFSDTDVDYFLSLQVISPKFLGGRTLQRWR